MGESMPSVSSDRDEQQDDVSAADVDAFRSLAATRVCALDDGDGPGMLMVLAESSTLVESGHGVHWRIGHFG